MLVTLRLRNFKAFKSFGIPLKPFSLIVGPNNAGKSTAISALRAVAAMRNYASRRNPPERRIVGDDVYRVFPFQGSQFMLEEENLRHDYDREHETSIELEWKYQRARLRAVWPDADSSQPAFFYTRLGGAGQPTLPARVRETFSAIGVIPPLRPLEQRERLLDSRYVRSNVATRLSSSHFRNQLELMERDGRFGSFLELAEVWLPELKLSRPRLAGDEIDLFYREGRFDREVAWAGDGIQVFLQILLHIHRLADVNTVVLDEPEVYLHADLQRRLVSLLESLDKQVILATHSSEIIVNAPTDGLLWIDKSHRRAVSATSGSDLGVVSDGMGSSFNLGLARVLRTKVALFVEGEDFKILRRLARTLGLHAVDAEVDIAVVPIEGSSNVSKLDTFDWVAKHLLQGAVRGYAIFDRDFASGQAIDARQQRLADAGIAAHTWERHEIESYLLCVPALSRVSGAEEGWIDAALVELSASMRDAAISGTMNSRIEEGALKKGNQGTLAASVTREVEAYWSDDELRRKRLPAKELVRGLNGRLQSSGFRTVSAGRIAAELRAHEIDPEVAELLAELDRERRS